MMVNSKALELAAADIRHRKRGPQALWEGFSVSAKQLDTAARILQDVEPSVISHINGRRVNMTSERPGFIEPGRQKNPQVLVFQVGIMGREYHIDRKGKVL